MLSVLSENGHTEYGENTDSYSNINFLNLGRKSQNNYVYDFISPMIANSIATWGTVYILLYLCFVNL